MRRKTIRALKSLMVINIFMEQELFYSHQIPDALYQDLEKIGFKIDSTEYKNIGNETFL